MKNTRTIASTSIKVNFSDLGIKQSGIEIDHIPNPSDPIKKSGKVFIRSKKENLIIGQVYYSITVTTHLYPKNVSILYISFVKESKLFPLAFQKKVVQGLMNYYPTDQITFAYKPLAEAVAGDYQTKAEPTKSKQHWGFVIQPHQI